MIQKGEFFIGTLHGFKILERHGSEIGDAGEGTKSSSDDVNTSQPGPALDFLIQNRFINRIPKHWGFKGIKFTTESSNCYVYCLTYELNAESMTRMDENYDTAVRILHPELFLAALTDSLHAVIKNIPMLTFKLGQCVYIYRDQHYSLPNSVPPMLIKEPRHSYQKEVRLVWETLDAEIEPILIKSAKASSFCSIVSDEELQQSTNSMKTDGH